MRLPKQVTEDTVVIDEKYVVWKRKDWEKFLEDWAGADEEMVRDLNEAALKDATVIRGQDLFAAPALDCYANSIGIAMMVMPVVTHDHQRKELEKTMDYFHERATEARMIGFKLPDSEDDS